MLFSILMKVLFVTHYSGCYGANVALLNLVIELRHRGVNSVVIIPGLGPIFKDLEANEIDYVVVPFHNWRGHFANQPLRNFIRVISWTLFDFIQALRVRKLIANRGIDLVHTNSSMTFFGALLSKVLKVSHIWHFREFGNNVDYEDCFILPNLLVKSLINTFGGQVVFISKSIQMYYANQLAIRNGFVIYDGVAKLGLSKAFDLAKPKEIINICVVGRLCGAKNQLDVLKGFKHLPAELLSKCKLNIIGDGEEEYERILKQFSADNSLLGRVRFWGFRNDVQSILENMHIGVISSKSEGFGLVTVEYMLNGVIAVASDSGANVELIQHGENGFLYRSGDYFDLAQVLAAVIKNWSMTEELRMTAYARASLLFSVEKNCEAIVDLYHDLLID